MRRVLSRRTIQPSRIKRFCHRQKTGFDRPDRDMNSGRPAPSFMRRATRSCLTLKSLDFVNRLKQRQKLTLGLRSNALRDSVPRL
jgi:hypothetical protein